MFQPKLDMTAWYAARVAEREAEKAAAEAAVVDALAKLRPGDRLPDGTIYAGISPDTNLPMAALPTDEGQVT